MSPETFRDILYSLSGLSFGAAGYALFAYASTFNKAGDKPSSIGHVLVKLSWLLTVGAVFVTILIPLTAIPPTLEGWVFATGLVLGFVGFVMVAHAERRKYHRAKFGRRRKGDSQRG